VPDTWPRPVPTVGDQTSAAERGADPGGWAFGPEEQAALQRIMEARRDIRRFRPDPVPDEMLMRLLAAAHSAPSVGHSQPWRFVVVTDPQTRARAATLADQSRLRQAAVMEAEAGRQLLDLDLEGIREAPLGVVVCCDRRVPASGVLGRATFVDADLWSCACAIQNLWLTARSEGLGVGWVTLFEPEDLRELIGAPEGVSTLGWLCVGWPDERPPAPGLERRGWSRREELEQVVIRGRWPEEEEAAPAQPTSRLAPPTQAAVVQAHDSGDRILAAPGSLGVLDRIIDRIIALGHRTLDGTLVIAAADHAVTRHGVSAYQPDVTRHVAEATVAGRSVGAVAAASAGLALVFVDAGVTGPPVDGADLARPAGPTGDLVTADALTRADTEHLMAAGVSLGRHAADLVALGEVGVGNTTAAAALAAALLGIDPSGLVGLGAGADSAMLAAKRRVVAAAVARVRAQSDPLGVLAALGGGEFAVLAGVTLGAASAGAVVVLDGLATSVAALVAMRLEPAVAAYLVAGQRSREAGHATVLESLGLEPLLDLRLRAGEGAGAALATALLRSALRIRLETARVTDPGAPFS
jgi:nicotinate-nucleotide--dimethylbenzimidazole phosphoribosyltransferase